MLAEAAVVNERGMYTKDDVRVVNLFVAGVSEEFRPKRNEDGRQLFAAAYKMRNDPILADLFNSC